MSLLADSQITQRVASDGIISPFIGRKVRRGVISYGLGHFGYDLRVSDEWASIDQEYVNQYRDQTGVLPVMDPKNLDENLFKTHYADYVDIPGHGFVLARTLEKFNIPDDITIVCLGKSTYARLGLVVNTTPFEAGWRGHAVIELSNTASLPIRVYANEGIAQALFFRGEIPCAVAYANGKYQDQGAEITLAKVER